MAAFAERLYNFFADPENAAIDNDLLVFKEFSILAEFGWIELFERLCFFVSRFLLLSQFQN